MPVRLKVAAQVLAVGMVAGLLALLIWKIASQDEGIAAELARGERPLAPDFTLPRLDRDGKLTLSSLRGKVVVLNFWASWCQPCKEEAPLLRAGWERWRGRGVVFLGVDAQDFKSDARRFMKRYGVTYPIVHDGPGDILPKYGVTGFPETFFIARGGRLVGEHVQGVMKEDQLTENIELALAS